MGIERYYKVDIAKKYGIGEAIFIHNLAFWIKKNQANNKHFYNGYYWIYNSYKAFTEQFEEFSKSQIETIIKNLIDKKVILKSSAVEDEERTMKYVNYYTICDKEILKAYKIEYSNAERQKEVSEKSEEVSEKSEEVSEKSEEVSEKSEEVSEKSEEVSEKSEEVSEKSEEVSEKSDTTDIYPDTSPEREPDTHAPARRDFENFITDFLVLYQKLMGHIVSDIIQVPFFKTFQNRSELKAIFENRRYNHHQCLKSAFEFANKRPPDKRFFSFYDCLKIYLQNGNDGLIARHYSEAELLEREKMARQKAEQQKAEAERLALAEKTEAEKYGLTVAEYRKRLEDEEDNIINEIRQSLRGA